MSNNKSYPSPDLSQRERNNKICAQSQSERNLPKGWKKVRLGDIVVINPLESMTKGTKAKKVPMEALEPFTKKIKLFQIERYKGGVKFRNGDTLMARITPSLENGKTAFVDFLCENEIGFGSTEFIVLRARYNESNEHFLYYFSISPKFRDMAIKSMTGSSGRQRVQTEVIKRYEFYLPPLPEQKAIASVLSSLDDKIDLLHRQNKTLELMAETMFKKYFKTPSHNLSQRERNNKMSKAKDDWEEKLLKEIYVFEKGFEPGSKSYIEHEEINSIRFIRVGDMLESRGNIYIKKETAIKECDEKDLLMSFDGTVGRLTFGIKGAYSSGIRKIYSHNPVYDNLGLKYLLFKSKDIQDLIRSYASGTVILHASSSINYLTFSFPEENIIKKFNQIITPIFEKILKNKRQIRTLEQLRDTLLPKLMSGEVRVG